MHKRIALGFVSFGLVAVLAGCGGSANGADSGAKSTGAAVGGKEVVVNLKSTLFEKSKLEVKAGTSVKWVNLDQTDHSVAEGEPESGKHLFKSKDYGTSQSYTYTFDKPGTYKVFCNTAGHHLIGMKMQVVVN